MHCSTSSSVRTFGIAAKPRFSISVCQFVGFPSGSGLDMEAKRNSLTHVLLEGASLGCAPAFGRVEESFWFAYPGLTPWATNIPSPAGTVMSPSLAQDDSFFDGLRKPDDGV